ncbi:MAG: hypothetical protein ABI690_32455 [Chloroflexota bacterium]
MYRKIGVSLLVVVMALSVAVAAASPGSAVKVTTPDGQTIPEIADGRLNGFDIAAPVVVYYTYPEGQPAVGETPTGVELLAVNQQSNNGYLVLNATNSDIQKLIDGKSTAVANNGYSLNYDRKNGWFWISTPGNQYNFSWDNTVFGTAATPQ